MSHSPLQQPRTRSDVPRRTAAAYTLVELVVVIGIIVILVAIAVPAVGPALNSNHQTEAIQQLTNAITLAQTRAQNMGGYAIRIERAFRTDQRGYMVDADGNSAMMIDVSSGTGVPNPKFNPSKAPIWLDYQQIRFLKPPREVRAYSPAADDPVKLPKNVWLAPDYTFYVRNLSAGYLFTFDPDHYALGKTWKAAGATDSMRLNPFETFCIVFDQRGNVIQLRDYVTMPSSSDDYCYEDQTQPVNVSGVAKSPVCNYPYPSARGVIVYDRSRFESLGGSQPLKRDFLVTQGKSMQINRFLGTLVEARSQ